MAKLYEGRVADRIEDLLRGRHGTEIGRRRVSGGWTAKRQPDLTQVMLIMSGGLVEFIPQRAHAVYTMHELKVATALIVHTSIVDDRIANRFVYLPGEV